MSIVWSACSRDLSVKKFGIAVPGWIRAGSCIHRRKKSLRSRVAISVSSGPRVASAATAGLNSRRL